uniref:type I-F CRISPR-associated endoribonuclease Cas6/Csy4 n=1 Tax=uncultured Acinetobacter sp. TaxID=165433 RepID=UPI002608E9B3|nr:type I-F CRISPR-associated endoribonuclease Cas6/Csy4 [uncultured Acinetobacter sp.]
MNFYQEITIIEQAEIPLYFIWSKLYTQLHLAFVEQKDDTEQITYGVSFPQYRLHEQKQLGHLGSKIRIFANSPAELEQLNLQKWLDRLEDYVHVTRPREVPQDKITGYANYNRTRPLKNKQTRILHQAKRRNISVEESAKYFEQFTEQKRGEPFIQLKSQSSSDIDQPKHEFSLYISKQNVETENSGKFGTYGLSQNSTVPEF